MNLLDCAVDVSPLVDACGLGEAAGDVHPAVHATRITRLHNAAVSNFRAIFMLNSFSDHLDDPFYLFHWLRLAGGTFLLDELRAYLVSVEHFDRQRRPTGGRQAATPL